MGAPAARVAELSRHWVRMGHEVTVLTGFPNHPTGVVPEEWKPRMRRLVYRETVDGVNVIRTWLWPLPNRKAHERVRNYSSFWLSASFTGLTIAAPDVVIGSSPQLLAALAGWWIAWTRRSPFVFEVRDLWPESLAAVGAGGEGSALHRALGAIAGFLYRHSAHIAVVTPAFKDHLIRHWRVPAEKISIVENGVETDLFRPCPSLAVEGARGRFVVCYIGTMGMAHGLDTLIRAAERLRQTFPRALFLMIGEGAEKERVIELARARGLDNVLFLDQQSRERIPAYIAGADVCLVMLRKTELFKTVIPTKMLEYMACGKAVIVAVDGQARQLIEDARAGVFIEPDNSEALAEAIVRMAGDPEAMERMGASGREFIVRKLSREQTARDYIRVLAGLLAESTDRDHR